MERIGECAFWGCPLEQISLPESLVEIGADAFTEYNFDQLVIPDSVVIIGEYAFGRSDHLHNATIGKSAKNYFNQRKPIFTGCGELTELTVRSEVAEYTGAKSLTKITICDTVKELGQWAFAECPNIEEAVVPDSVTKIGYGAFLKDENLKTIELSDNITEIGEVAFDGTRLKEIIARAIILNNFQLVMTKEQYNLLMQYAADFRSALCAYEQEYGIIDLKTDHISDIVAAGANLMHLVDTLKSINATHDEDPF